MSQRKDNVTDIATKRPLATNGNGGNGDLTEYRLGQLEKKVEGLDATVDRMAHQLTRIETKIGIFVWIAGIIMAALLTIAVRSLW